jgi:hypothetical protein
MTIKAVVSIISEDKDISRWYNNWAKFIFCIFGSEGFFLLDSVDKEFSAHHLHFITLYLNENT